MADIAIRHRQGRFILDASFSLTGAWTVIFGPSGAGKTTLLRIRHLDRGQCEARVSEMLRLFGAESLADQPAPQLSGGERKRIALARALAPAPDLILLDEPLAGLDDNSAHDILERPLSLQPSGQVSGQPRVVYVSHDLAEIWRLPAEVVFLESGRVTAVGPLQQVLAPHRDQLLQQLR